MSKLKTRLIHFDTIYNLCVVRSVIQGDSALTLSKEDKLAIQKALADEISPDKEQFLGFIFLDDKHRQQRNEFETVVRPVLEKAGRSIELVHESPYFCNRGYFYGNVLQFVLFKVTRNDI